MTIREEITNKTADFRYLSKENIEKLQSSAVLRSYKKGQVLFDQGDQRNKLYYLKSGVMKFERIDSSGTFFYFDFMKSKELFPRMGLFTDEQYCESAVAYTDIEIISIPVPMYEEMIIASNQQLVHWIKRQSVLLKMNMIKIQKGTMSNTSHRVETTLAMIIHDLGEMQYPLGTVGLPCPLTINDIAKASGTTRETTSSIMKQLVAKKKIDYKQKKLKVLDVTYFDSLLAD